jgi:predicted Zn-dependent protease
MSRITVLSLLIIVGAAVSYIFYLNPAPVELVYGPGKAMSAPLALILISVFAGGFLFASLIAFALGLRQSWLRWKEVKRIRQSELHQQQIVHAREELAAGNWTKARGMFQRIIDQDPQNIVARIMLAETYRRQNEVPSAIKVLDECRAEQRENLELLFLAAELNTQLGNKTAACDNLSLVLKAQPSNAAALEKLAFYSQSLDRPEQAREFYQRLVKVTPADRAEEVQDRLALAELASASKEFDQTSAEYKRAVEDVLKRHRDFAPALGALAEVERNGARLDLATKLWLRAFKFSGEPTYLEAAAQTWLKIDQPARALEAVKNGVVARSADDSLNVQGRLYLISMLLRLEMVEDAQTEIEALASNLTAEDPNQPALQYLRAKTLFRRGEVAEAIKRLYAIIEQLVEIPGIGRSVNGLVVERTPLLPWHQQVEQPAARLS